jgi:predicted  nucleic acid-binding Zn-ribbon protein
VKDVNVFWKTGERLEALESRVDDLGNRVEELETRVDSVEERITRGLNRLGDYKNRTRDELLEMRGQIAALIETLEAVVAHAENREGTERARALLKRARGHRTRVDHRLSSVA